MVTVPLHSTTGQLSGIYTRRIDMSNGGPIEQHIGQGIFNAQALQQFDECIVTATVLDAWTLTSPAHVVDHKIMVYLGGAYGRDRDGNIIRKSISPNSNFHYYRQDSDDFWSHKSGSTERYRP